MGIDENVDTEKADFAKLAYRIILRKLHFNVYPKLLQLQFDPATLKRLCMNSTDYANSPCARFTLSGVDEKHQAKDQPIFYTFLDKQMETVSGADNLRGSNTLRPTFLNSFITETQCFSADKNLPDEPLDESYYRGSYMNSGKLKERVSFSDRVYMAKTSQDEVVGPTLKIDNTLYKSKNSYATPLEVIYLNPLQVWNPYKLRNYIDCSEVTGEGTKDKPFTGVCPKLWYMIPAKFFKEGDNDDCVNLETLEKGAYVMRPDGEVSCFYASGVRVVYPSIKGVKGRMRQRYPIMQVTAEGSCEWKKLNAMEDTIDWEIEFDTGKSTLPDAIVFQHTHIVKLTKFDLKKLKANEFVQKVTEKKEHHQHIITVKMREDGKIEITNCNGDNIDDNLYCFDKHNSMLTERKRC